MNAKSTARTPRRRDPGIVKVGKHWLKFVVLPRGGVVTLQASRYKLIAELLRLLGTEKERKS